MGKEFVNSGGIAKDAELKLKLAVCKVVAVGSLSDEGAISTAGIPELTAFVIGGDSISHCAVDVVISVALFCAAESSDIVF
jgi:hypothetical protein